MLADSLTDGELSVTEYAVLGLLSEGDSHGFALAKQLENETEVGRVFTVRRPLVYRALDRLVAADYARPVGTEPGTAGPKRVVHTITDRGRSILDEWLIQPVDHVRDLRIDFLLKVTMLDRFDRSPIPLIHRQKRALDETLDALGTPRQVDHVELWRQHNARAASTYLDELKTIYTRK